MLSLRLVRAAGLVRPLNVSRVIAPAVTRSFTQTASVKADLITDLYLQELRKYTPPKESAADAADLPTTFAPPAAPAKPEIDVKTTDAVANAADEAVEEEEWPAVYNPIDDPANYPDEWDFTTENDDGSLLPKRLKPVDYDHH
ncbi:uncharacterized protein SPPG_03164 [Spizellomyces punctatus DAOM BR117]|uniref:Uncharacterized protein n=1 Tax=Spizellomyces punctatus (strain DAOM BR117) TaxID=645134 RepID=A0A0L0HJQ4_SPIPD|nr:uncharacterized protein SPPG_03164 [Spizellomyces punctatus DAOM BR117]KND01352.1 hypothetical protein SPPG_03164 [Spizellomyces punctatus DAOM BR117]|eukprot:XP_016609391.1 hypothetical protein SPPG_03164 [Spizellomyces punctatus DAOM BR117]